MTQLPAFLYSSGDQRVDTIINGVISLLELLFPQRIVSYALAGSFADSTATSLSDIDLIVVFASAPQLEETTRLRTAMAACKQISPRNIDLVLLDSDMLCHANRLTFELSEQPVLGCVAYKYAAVPVFGADLRPQTTDVPFMVYRRTMLHFPFVVLRAQRGQPERLTLPLPPPEPNDEFLGYTGVRLRGPDGVRMPSTKRLVHASGYIATAFVALTSNQYIGDKRSGVRAYCATIRDEWAAHLEALQELCYRRWGYRVPDEASDRLLLRELTERQLAFENHFIEHYIAFLHVEHHAEYIDNVARSTAEERLRCLGRL
jgi:predicted nucleotidyltransferase